LTKIFERIASAEGGAKGIFAAEAMAGYQSALGREVRTDEVQSVTNELLAANLIMRHGHGIYGITDPFVQEIWKEKQELESKIS
jgi:hypothetical protein